MVQANDGCLVQIGREISYQCRRILEECGVELIKPICQTLLHDAPAVLIVFQDDDLLCHDAARDDSGHLPLTYSSITGPEPSAGNNRTAPGSRSSPQRRISMATFRKPASWSN